MESKVTCVPVSHGSLMELSADRGVSSVVNIYQPAMAIVFVLRRADVPLYTTRDGEGSLTLTGVNGWVSLTNMEPSFRSLGELDYFSIEKGLSNVKIDGVDRPISSNSEISLVGDIRPEYLDGGGIRITATADAAWLDGLAVNRTRWEQIDNGWKLAIVGGVLTVLGSLLQLARVQMRGRSVEDPVAW